MNNALIANLQLHTQIFPEDQKLINDSFKKRKFNEGDQLFTGGRICHEMFFIDSGVLKITITNEKGIDVTHFFVKENQFCTILNSFNNEVPATENIVAACDAEVFAITKSALLLLYRQLPYLKALIDQITQQRLFG